MKQGGGSDSVKRLGTHPHVDMVRICPVEFDDAFPNWLFSFRFPSHERRHAAEDSKKGRRLDRRLETRGPRGFVDLTKSMESLAVQNHIVLVSWLPRPLPWTKH